MDNHRFQIEMTDAAAQSLFYSTVALWHKTVSDKQGIGSGALVRKGDNLYILTCHHVAEEFFSSTTVEAKAIRPDRLGNIERDNLVLEHFDMVDDIALLRVLDPSSVKESLRVLTRDDFQMIDDFTTLSAPNRAFAINGYPGKAHEYNKRTDHLTITPVTYITYQVLDPKQAPYWLTLDYREGEHQPMHEPVPGTDSVVPLIPANGFSGSPVRMILVPLPGDPSLWHFGMSKIVAIQQATNHKDWIRCSPLRRLRDWLFSDQH